MFIYIYMYSYMDIFDSV